MSKCRVCRGPAVIDLPGTTPTSVPSTCSSCAGVRWRKRSRTTACSSRPIACSSRSAAARTRSQSGIVLLDLGYQADGLYLGLGIGEYSDDSGAYARDFAERRGLHLRTIDLRRDLRLRRADGGRSHASRAVLGMRPLEAASVRRSGPRRRLRRRGDGPQPRRRGRRAVRQRAAVGGRFPRSAITVPPGRRRLPTQGQAARAADGAGDGGVVHHAGHRLPGRGVPDGRWQQAPPVQGDAEPPGRGLAGDQGGVLSRFPRADGAAPRGSFDGRRRRTAGMRPLRLADDDGGVCLLPSHRRRRRARAGGGGDNRPSHSDERAHRSVAPR